jgi:hypothetical protein
MMENIEPTLRNEETRKLVIDLLEACRAATRSLAESLPFVDDSDPYLGQIYGQVSQRNDTHRAMLRKVTRQAERWLLNYGNPEERKEPSAFTDPTKAVAEWVKDGKPRAIINLKNDEQGGFLIPGASSFVPKPGLLNVVRRTFHIGGWKEFNFHDHILTAVKQAKVNRVPK